MAAISFQNIRLIATREYRARVLKRSFFFGTAFMVILALVLGFAPLIINAISSANAQTKVVVLDTAGPIVGQDPDTFITTLSQSLNTSATGAPTNSKPPFVITKAAGTDPAALKQQVKDGKLESVLVVSRSASNDLIFDYTTKNDSTGSSTSQIKQIANFIVVRDRLQSAGLNAAQQQQAFSPATFNVVSTSNDTFNNGKTGIENAVGYVITFALVILLFTTVNLYGQWIAQGVVEEKSSRVMEIMINAAKPSELMLGKILGIGGAGLSQFALFAIAAVGGLLAQKPISDAFGVSSSASTIDLTGTTTSLLFAFVFFFILGFALYSTLYAGLASLVSRQEDVQSALAPLVFLNMGGYLAAIFSLQSINETWVKIASFVPFFSPILMIARLGVGTVSVAEIVIALVLMVFTTILMTLLAARLYRNGILHYGNKPKILSVLRQSGRTRGTQVSEKAPASSNA